MTSPFKSISFTAATLVTACASPGSRIVQNTSSSGDTSDNIAAVTEKTKTKTPRQRPLSCDFYTIGARGVHCNELGGEDPIRISETPLSDGALFKDELIVWNGSTATVYRIDLSSRATLQQSSLRPPVPDTCDPSAVWPTTRLLLGERLLNTAPETVCFEVSNGQTEELEDLRFAGSLNLRDFSLSHGLVWNSTSCNFSQFPATEGCLTQAPSNYDAIATKKKGLLYFLDGSELKAHNSEDGSTTTVWGPLSTRTHAPLEYEGLDVVSSGWSSFEAVGVSTSGRTVILAGNATRGDVLHFEVLVFDRKQGTINTLPTTPGQDWPPPTSVSQLENLEPGSTETLTVLRSASPRFVGDNEAFAIGTLLFKPGEGAIRLKGSVALVWERGQSTGDQH